MEKLQNTRRLSVAFYVHSCRLVNMGKLQQLKPASSGVLGSWIIKSGVVTRIPEHLSRYKQQGKLFTRQIPSIYGDCVPYTVCNSDEVHIYVVVLLFHVHGKHLWSCRVMSGRSVNLTTLFLGRLRPPKRLTSTSSHTFASN